MLGNFYSAGQVCSQRHAGFRAERASRTRFLARLAARAAAIRAGRSRWTWPRRWGRWCQRAQHDKVLGYIAKARAEGARLICGGGARATRAAFVQPTVFADVTDDMTIAREEMFGPVMAVLDFETEDEAVARANATEFGLAAGVFTADLARAHRVIGGAGGRHLPGSTPITSPRSRRRLAGRKCRASGAKTAARRSSITPR